MVQYVGRVRHSWKQWTFVRIKSSVADLSTVGSIISPSVVNPNFRSGSRNLPQFGSVYRAFPHNYIINFVIFFSTIYFLKNNGTTFCCCRIGIRIAIVANVTKIKLITPSPKRRRQPSGITSTRFQSNSGRLVPISLIYTLNQCSDSAPMLLFISKR